MNSNTSPAPGTGQHLGIDHLIGSLFAYLKHVLIALPQPAKFNLPFQRLAEIARDLPTDHYPVEKRVGIVAEMYITDAKSSLLVLFERADSLRIEGNFEDALTIARTVAKIVQHVHGAQEIHSMAQGMLGINPPSPAPAQIAGAPAVIATTPVAKPTDKPEFSVIDETAHQLGLLAKDVYNLKIKGHSLVGVVEWLDDHTADTREWISERSWKERLAMVGCIVVVALIVWWISIPIKTTLPTQPQSVVNSPYGLQKNAGSIKAPNRKAVPLRQAPDYDPKELSVATSMGSGPRDERVSASAKEKQLLRLLIEEQMDYVNLRHGNMVTGIEKVAALNPLVEKSVQDFYAENPKMAESFESQLGLPRENLADLELALIWRESAGDENATSPSKPFGLGQFAVMTAQSDQLGRYRLVGEPIYKPDPKNKRKKVLKGYTYDYRNVPEKVVPAILQLLKIEYEKFGNRWDLAIFAYHSGDNRVSTIVQAAKDDKYQWQTFDDLFFVDPIGHTRTWKAVQSLMDGPDNYGPTYFYGVYRGMGHLGLYWTNVAAFERLAVAQLKQDTVEEGNLCRAIGEEMISDKPLRAKEEAVAPLRKRLDDPKILAKPADEVSTRRYWSAYGCRDLLQNFTFSDMKAAAKDGKIVPPPSGDWGVSIRPADKGGPGSYVKNDPRSVEIYQRLSPEAWGMFIIVAYHFREIRNKNLDLTSLIRDWAYQKQLNEDEKKKTGKDGKTMLPLHTLTIGGDVGFRNYSAEDVFALKYVLNMMEYAGLISWAPEGDHYHVVVMPSPKAKQVFMRVYQNAVNPK